MVRLGPCMRLSLPSMQGTHQNRDQRHHREPSPPSRYVDLLNSSEPRLRLSTQRSACQSLVASEDLSLISRSLPSQYLSLICCWPPGATADPLSFAHRLKRSEACVGHGTTWLPLSTWTALNRGSEVPCSNASQGVVVLACCAMLYKTLKEIKFPPLRVDSVSMKAFLTDRYYSSR